MQTIYHTRSWLVIWAVPSSSTTVADWLWLPTFPDSSGACTSGSMKRTWAVLLVGFCRVQPKLSYSRPPLLSVYSNFIYISLHVVHTQYRWQHLVFIVMSRIASRPCSENSWPASISISTLHTLHTVVHGNGRFVPSNQLYTISEHVTEEVFRTILSKVEGIVTSKPLVMFMSPQT